MQVLDRNNRENAREYVARVLKKNIINCTIKPGEMLSENVLAEQLHVSRTPVREALVELSKLRLIEVIPQKGSMVTMIDYDLAADANFSRKVLEHAIIELCCAIGDEGDLDRLQENVELQDFYYKRGNYDKLLELDDEFHHQLFILAKKERVYQHLRDIVIHFDRIRYLSLIAVVDLKAISDHSAILKAVQKKNKKQAAELMDQHLSRFVMDKEAILKRFPDYII